MTLAIRLDEDWHVHSTFSDGADTLDTVIRAAEAAGLRHLGCVDHVRNDATYVPQFIRAVEDAKPNAQLALSAGIEAKILDRAGTLDLPDQIAGIDLIYVADHQFPGVDGPVSPRQMREAILSGTLSADDAIEQLTGATIAAMHRFGTTHRLVLAHLFSILPKLGLNEDLVSDHQLRQLAEAARDSATIVEISERWKCPGIRTARAFAELGVSIVASTDSHRAFDIARYDYVRTLGAG